MSEKSYIRNMLDFYSAAETILEIPVETKEKISTLILDSAIEVACKDYLRYNKKIKVDRLQKISHDELMKMMKQHVSDDILEKSFWDDISNFHYSRNPLHHFASDATMTHSAVRDMFECFEFLVNKLFNFNLKNEYSKVKVDMVKTSADIAMDINKVEKDIDKVILAISKTRASIKDPSAIHAMFDMLGLDKKEKKRIDSSKLSVYLNSSGYFYKDNSTKEFYLSEKGKIRLGELKNIYFKKTF